MNTDKAFRNPGPAVLIILAAAVMIFNAADISAGIITDDVGRKVEIKLPVHRIVSLSPAQTEMLYYLDAQDKLVGVSTQCNYPEEAKQKEKAGTFMNPDMEKIVSLSPDCVFSAGGIQKKTIRKLEKLGIPVVVFYPRSLKDIKNNMLMVAEAAGKTEEKSEEIKAFCSAFAPRPGIAAEKVYVEMWPDPVMGVGGSSYINEIIEVCGGKNIISSEKKEYPRVSPEEIIKRDPDIIILLYKPGPGYMEDKRFSLTKAGKNSRIYVIEGKALDEILRPGPRVVKGIMRFREILLEAESE